MEVLIDGKPLATKLAADAAVKDALEEVHRELASRRRFAVRIVLDGVTIEEPEKAAAAADPVAGHARLEVATEEPEALCAQVLGDLLPFVASLKAVHQKSAEVLHAGHLKEALEGVQACVQGWSLVIRGVRHVGAILQEFSPRLPYDPAELKKNVGDLEKALRDFKKNLDQQDLARLADRVEYDLASRLDYWEGVLSSMLAKIEGGGNGGKPSA